MFSREPDAALVNQTTSLILGDAMGSMVVTVSYEQSPADLRALTKYLVETSPQHRRAKTGVTIGIAVVFITLACVMAYSADSLAAGGIGAGFFALSGYVLASNFRRSYADGVVKRVDRMHEREPMPSLSGRETLSFGNDGVTIENEHVRADYRWSAFTKYVETDSHIFLFIGPMQAFTLPKLRLEGAGAETIAEMARESIVARRPESPQ